jgi:acetyl esterase/lipase
MKSGATLEIITDVIYSRPKGQVLSMDIMRPKQLPRDPLPTIVYIHGGGWFCGSRIGMAGCFMRFAQRGYCVASVSYRLVPNGVFPDAINDCKCAVRFLRAHAKELHLHPEQFVAWGESAGGHLVALMGTTSHLKTFDAADGWNDQASHVNAVVDYCGPSELIQFAAESDFGNGLTKNFLGGPVAEKKDLARQASPVTHVTPKAPPFLIVHGDKDTAVQLHQSDILVEALRKAGTPVEYEVIKEGGHAGYHPGQAQLVDAFLDRYVQPR